MNRFSLKEKIGSGGYGNIYSAICLDETRRKVAIKTINSTERGLSCLNEAYLLVSGPGRSSFLLSSEFVFCNSSAIYFILPLARASLDKYRFFNPLSSIEFRKCFDSLKTAISSLWSFGYFHCDIKAANVLVFDDRIENRFSSSSLEFILGDFSSSRICSSKEASYSRYTISHRAIEVIEEEKISQDSEVWAMGCTFFEAKYGYSLFVPKDIENAKNLLFLFSSNRLERIPKNWQKKEFDEFDFEILSFLSYLPKDRAKLSSSSFEIKDISKKMTSKICSLFSRSLSENEKEICFDISLKILYGRTFRKVSSLERNLWSEIWKKIPRLSSLKDLEE
jgi:serine/threonine protein kinase